MSIHISLCVENQTAHNTNFNPLLLTFLAFHTNGRARPYQKPNYWISAVLVFRKIARSPQTPLKPQTWLVNAKFRIQLAEASTTNVQSRFLSFGNENAASCLCTVAIRAGVNVCGLSVWSIEQKQFSVVTGGKLEVRFLLNQMIFWAIC